MPEKIFISYRRDDAAAVAGRLYDHLVEAFDPNDVFLDVDQIPAGVDFATHIEAQVAACDVFLAIIGPRWLAAADEKGERRLGGAEDFVTIEVASALARRIPVIPVLVDGAKMPRGNELPGALKALARRNAVEVRHAHFPRDAADLIDKIRAAVAPKSPPRRLWPVIAGGGALLVAGLAAAGVYLNVPKGFEPASPNGKASVSTAEAAKGGGDSAASAQWSLDATTTRSPQPAPTNAPRSAESDAKKPAAPTAAPPAVEPKVAAFEQQPRAIPAPVDAVPGSGKSFRDPAAGGAPCPNCPQMVAIPQGVFVMGSNRKEVEELLVDRPDLAAQFDWETPQRQIRITAPLAVGLSHVTVGEYKAFVSASGHPTTDGCYVQDKGTWVLNPKRSWRSPGFEQTDQHPVVCVSWIDAQAYTTWLSQITGKRYRLLSGAESEYAARATSRAILGQRYFFGNDAKALCAHGNGAHLSAASVLGGDPRLVVPCDDAFVYTAPIASFKANAWGLHDVHGNVWSWTADCWNDSHAKAPPDGTAITSGDCTQRVVRGGSWSNGPYDLRASSRDHNNTQDRTSNLGFRVARSLDEP